MPTLAQRVDRLEREVAERRTRDNLPGMREWTSAESERFRALVRKLEDGEQLAPEEENELGELGRVHAVAGAEFVAAIKRFIEEV